MTKTDPKPGRPPLEMYQSLIEGHGALAKTPALKLLTYCRHLEAQQQAPLGEDVEGVAALLDAMSGKDQIIARDAATALRALARERDRLQHKMEQYQLQLEDGWAAHIDKLNEVVAENAALRERLEAAQRDTERLISEARVAVQALVNAGWDFKARALQAAIDSAARSAAQGDGEASDGDSE